jgi:hypothetical protein
MARTMGRNEVTDAPVRTLAARKRKTLTATIREPVEREYEREYGGGVFMREIAKLQDWVDAHSKSGGLPADKAFLR